MMNARAAALAIVSIAVSLAPIRITAQTPAANKSAATKAAPAAKSAKWTVPRLADGRPDFGGYWNNHTATSLERPETAGGREFLTEDEIKVIEGRVPTRFTSNPFPNLWAGDARWVMSNKRTSIITDPKDGKIPPLTPDAQRKFDADRKDQTVEYYRGPEDLPTFVRCLPVSTSGPPMLPTAYNNNYQIVQTRDHVAIATEMMHDVRIIPVDGRPHSDIRQWSGDSRGRYEGDTLVVETRNFNGKRGYLGPGGADLKRHDEKMIVTERFTRTDPDTLLYQFTVNDPGLYTKPWSGEITMKPYDHTILEYACHEGNHAMVNILAGARAEDAEAAKSGTR